MPQFRGRCHCGAVQFETNLELDQLMTCNCSLCGRTGAIMAFVPLSQVNLVCSPEAQTDYQFGKKKIHHPFCTTCGVRTLGWGPGHDGTDWAMVNVRCIEDLDTHTLTVARQFDGKNL
jgi:hypothetical protein